MQYEIAYINSDGHRASEPIEPATAFEMAAAALRFMNVEVVKGESFETFTARFEEANRFATFAVAETIDQDGTCDPRANFRTLYGRFIETERA